MATVAESYALAVQHHQAGRIAEAEAQYRTVIHDAPQHAEALHLLGVIAHQTGRHQEAIDLIGRALAARGPNPVFHSNLAAAYLATHRWIEAAAHCRAALKMAPNFSDAHNNLGIALRSQGQVAEAEVAFRAAVRLSPDFVDALCNLGAVLPELGNLADARTHLEAAVRLAPQYAHAHNTLGGVLLGLGQTDEAVAHLREAVHLQPKNASAHNNLGVGLEHLLQFDEAIRCFQEAVRLDPDYVSAHNNLGSALRNQGDIPAALAEFEIILRLDPNHAMTIFNLGKMASVGAYRFSADQIEHIRELLTRPNLSPDNRSRLHYALAQVFDKAGAYDDAFDHCQAANDLRKEILHRRGTAFDLAALRRQVDRIIASPGVPGVGADSELPIFIVGMPRSGTSLAEQILSSHPQMYGAGELSDMDRLVQAIAPLAPDGRGVGGEGLFDPATAHRLGADHLSKLKQLGGDALRVLDKAPFNFLHLGVIATLFPRARVIHCMRDPLDTCLSCFFQNFAEPYPFTFDLEHLGQYYREYQRLMAHWRTVLPLPLFELSYEELTDDQENVSRRLVAFCGLEWDKRCLSFHENPRVVRTFSTLQVRQPMYRSSVGRWKRYERHLGPLIKALGAG